MVTLSIIVLTYNSSKYISNCLESIIEKYSTEIKSNVIELIIADNESSDATIKTAEKYNKFGVKIVNNNKNLGFAKGNNEAVKKTHGRYILFINPDTELIYGSLPEMVDIFEKDDLLGVVGGKMVDFNGKNELSCGKEYSLLRTFFLAAGLDSVCGNRFSPNRQREVDSVSGGFMIVRASLFEKLHGFDENFFMYIEDIEFCLRVKKVGYRVMFSPAATIKHLGQGSSNKSFAIANIYKGLLYLYKKHHSRFSYVVVKLLLVAKARVLVLTGKMLDNKNLTATYVDALKNI